MVFLILAKVELLNNVFNNVSNNASKKLHLIEKFS